MKIIFFTGPPGSGKGTQTLMLCDYLKSKGKKCDVISVGEKLREVQSKESFFSKDLANNLKEGNLVPSVYPISLSLESFLESFEKNTDYILFDGGIRKSVEATLWLEVLKLLPEVEISCIVINVSKEEIKKRLSKRGREDDMAADKRISLWEGEKRRNAISDFI